MALIFPNNPSNGDPWEDDCGDTWYYIEATNSWYKPVDARDIPGSTSPFVRDSTTGEIYPRNSGDYLDMEPGRINISLYPDA
jgi:hypothetical protein